ncbi:hypothetical protein [Actibacterium lipolyticum]|nr:hypothetical protein [Actibacterium lipolyticum]
MAEPARGAALIRPQFFRVAAGGGWQNEKRPSQAAGAFLISG